MVKENYIQHLKTAKHFIIQSIQSFNLQTYVRFYELSQNIDPNQDGKISSMIM